MYYIFCSFTTFSIINHFSTNLTMFLIKDFSNWPTVPQLYVKGEFVGGADILREMFEDGELEGFFDKAGIVREINS